MASIALCIICKNERHNLPRLLESIEGCFDQIHITDTGSTDGTLEYLEWMQGDGKLSLHHFEWIDDFSAARNHSFSHSTADYNMWIDCDDVLENKEAFIEWKNSLLETANYWLATYHYGLAADGTPSCSFVRERVLKNHMGYQWNYFVHEGVPPIQHLSKAGYATSWSIKHLRTAEDQKADRNRNLSIFEKNKDKMDDRMSYYYGKELFEANLPLEAYNQLIKTHQQAKNLEMHDKVLCIQYACMAAMMCHQYKHAIDHAHDGLKELPNRAEFWVILGDCYLKLNQFDNAIPCFAAAANCINQSPNDAVFQTPLFTHKGAYTHYPRNQLGRIFFQKQQIDKAYKWIQESNSLGIDTESEMLMKEIQNVKTQLTPRAKGSVPVLDEYVISCPLIAPYLWDENIAKERGIGGSETAVVHMARHLRNMTGKTIRVFNERQNDLEIDGVFYHPSNKMAEYFKNGSPKANIMWRHNIINHGDYPSYIWCHDLMTMGMERTDNYHKLLALSEFHKNFLKHGYRIPEDKIQITRNGIDLSRFKDVDFSSKNPNKVVFSSSPDRGLDRAIHITKMARELSGKDLELHVFYGFDNMLKMGLQEPVSKLKKLISDHPWVKYHGNVQQNALVHHLKDAKAWLYPTDFLETFCITALEMLACRVTPVVRRYGALPFTLQDQPSLMVARDCLLTDDLSFWAQKLLEGLEMDQPVVNMEPYSWESVARDWLTWLPN